MADLLVPGIGFTRFFAGLSLLVFVGTIGASAQESSRIWQAPEYAKTMKNPVKMTSKGLMAASDLYEQKCALCHGDLGSGDGALAPSQRQKPADITDSKRMSVATDGELFWKISTGHGSMPSWQQELSDTQRWQLVSYLRVLSAYRLYRYLGRPMHIGLPATGGSDTKG